MPVRQLETRGDPSSQETLPQLQQRRTSLHTHGRLRRDAGDRCQAGLRAKKSSGEEARHLLGALLLIALHRWGHAQGRQAHKTPPPPLSQQDEPPPSALS